MHINYIIFNTTMLTIVFNRGRCRFNHHGHGAETSPSRLLQLTWPIVFIFLSFPFYLFPSSSFFPFFLFLLTNKHLKIHWYASHDSSTFHFNVYLSSQFSLNHNLLCNNENSTYFSCEPKITSSTNILLYNYLLNNQLTT